YYDGELCFYNGVGRRRALFRSIEPASEGFVPGGNANLDEAVARYREALQENPFTEELPTIFAGVRLVEADGRSHIEDANGKRIPIEVRDEVRFATWAVSGGRPFTAFLLAAETAWELVSIWYPTDHSDYYFWRDERD
ncbi:MAG: SWIM zinc finger family protein, partial [Rikenella sp.]|nr:SWIM zinc finger family protein [Rikenella sp.]